MKLAEKGAFIWFILSIMMIAFAYGVLVGKYHWFPYQHLMQAKKGLEFFTKKQWYYFDDPNTKPLVHPLKAELQAGLNLVTRINKNNTLAIEIVDADRKTVHSYHVDWFENWPDPTHIPESSRPKSAPGTHIHGAIVTPDGDLVFNFENLGLLKMGKDSSIKWRLPVETHHSIHPTADGNMWVSGSVPRDIRKDYPYIFRSSDESLLLVSPDGEILRQHSVIDILAQNGLSGLLHVRAPLTPTQIKPIAGDIIHLNDVEEFPPHMEEGFFKHGDLMISLRNIATILVVDPDTLKIKFQSIGVVDQQHDPDFVDGNTITVFDNNTHSLVNKVGSSRIVQIDVPSGELSVIFEGTPEKPFYTPIMGKHQWLANGNLLITEPLAGRAFELTPSGKIVWEYRNTLDGKTMGLVDEVQRLSPAYDSIFTSQ